MGVITQFIEAITQWLTGFIGLVVGENGVLTSVVKLFYTPSDGLTVFGILGLMGMAIGLVHLGLAFVRRMFNK